MVVLVSCMRAAEVKVRLGCSPWSEDTEQRTQSGNARSRCARGAAEIVCSAFQDSASEEKV